MSRHIRALLIMALLTSAYAFAADFSGKWVSNGSDSAGGILVVLRQEGARLSGNAGPNESRQFPILSGTVEGDHLSFEVKMGGGTIRFDLVSAGAQLKGTARLKEDDGHTASMNVVLKRVP